MQKDIELAVGLLVLFFSRWTDNGQRGRQSRGSVTQSPGGNYLNLANINHYPPPPTPDIQTKSEPLEPEI